MFNRIVFALTTAMCLAFGQVPQGHTNTAIEFYGDNNARVRMEESIARGMRTCSILLNQTLYVFLAESWPRGRIGRSQLVTVLDDLYPGSYIYVALGEQRFSGEEDIFLDDELLKALRNGSAAHVRVAQMADWL